MMTLPQLSHPRELILSVDTIADVPGLLKENLSPEELAVTSIFFDIDWTALTVSRDTFFCDEIELWVHEELLSGRITPQKRTEIHSWVMNFPAQSREGAITQHVIAELKKMVPCFVYLTARRDSIAEITKRHLAEAELPLGTALSTSPQGLVSTNGFPKADSAEDLYYEEETVNATRCMVLIDDSEVYVRDFASVCDTLGVRYIGIHYAREKEIPNPIRSEAITKFLQRNGLLPEAEDLSKTPPLAEVKTSDEPQG